MKKWVEFADQLALSESEFARCVAFKGEKTSKCCLDFYRVLKHHGFGKEAAELLDWALVLHVAGDSTVLEIAQDYFELGRFADLRSCLEREPGLSKTSVKAKNLLFLSAVGLGQKTQALSLQKELEKHASSHMLSHKLMRILKTFGFDSASVELRRSFLERRIVLSEISG